MRTGLIIKTKSFILPPLARLCNDCYDFLDVNWRCVINSGFNARINCDLLVNKEDVDLSKLARIEGRCDYYIVVNYGDRCDLDYADNIKPNSIGISNLCDCEGNVLDEPSFIQRSSFACYSVNDKTELTINRSLNILIAQVALQEDIERYNLTINDNDLGYIHG